MILIAFIYPKKINTNCPNRSLRQCSRQTANGCTAAQVHGPCVGQHPGQAGRRLSGVRADQGPPEGDQSALRESGRRSATNSSVHLCARTVAGRFRHSSGAADEAVQDVYEAAECEQ